MGDFCLFSLASLTSFEKSNMPNGEIYEDWLRNRTTHNPHTGNPGDLVSMEGPYRIIHRLHCFVPKQLVGNFILMSILPRGYNGKCLE